MPPKQYAVALESLTAAGLPEDMAEELQAVLRLKNLYGRVTTTGPAENEFLGRARCVLSSLRQHVDNVVDAVRCVSRVNTCRCLRRMLVLCRQRTSTALLQRT